MSQSLAPRFPAWLKTAVGYQIYPQSFQDSNGDGVGDLRGILSRVDYLAELGVNLVWLSPIYDSPFLDAGYDVRDFKAIAPRYGTLEDFRELVAALHGRGIRLMLDLVPGHTSIDHPWFLESCKAEPNACTNRYVWSRSMYSAPSGQSAGAGFLQGYGEREGAVAVNFFWSQPKLNYGVLKPDPAKPWELPFDHPDARALRDEMFGIIRHWLDLGVDGFRIDSAKSVCPDRPPLGEGTFYRRLREMLDRDYPQAALLAEWGWPCDSLACGIHVDFLLQNNKAFNELFSMPDWENGVAAPLFSPGGGDVARFLGHFLPHHEKRHGGLISIMTGNHDYMRCGTGRSAAMLKALYSFILTMPGMPMVYYGDEIGLPFLAGLRSKEGGYRRTGARTPMQWTAEGGFSAAPESEWYLPQHAEGVTRAAHNVDAQRADADSLLNHVRRLIELRKTHPALSAEAEWEPLARSGPTLVYTRRGGGARLLVVVHPPDFAAEAPVPEGWSGAELRPVCSSGCVVDVGAGRLRLAPNGWAIFGEERVSG
jgi:maltose alpha-D-glucosyltransferase/alpha-amylase